MSIKVLLDNNAIIDIEENREDKPYVLELIQLHNSGKIEIKLPSIQASENLPDEQVAENFDEYLARESIQLIKEPEIYPCVMHWDLTYWGQAVWGGEEKGEELEELIKVTMFHRFDFSTASQSENPKRVREWRNKMCDVQMMWTAIYYECDILVTRDGNFKEHLSALNSVNPPKILTPKEAVEYCNLTLAEVTIV